MKYKINQPACYMHNDKIESGMIQSQITVKHADEDFADLELVKNSQALYTSKYRKDGSASGNFYITRHGIFAEAELFATKEELVATL